MSEYCITCALQNQQEAFSYSDRTEDTKTGQKITLRSDSNSIFLASNPVFDNHLDKGSSEGKSEARVGQLWRIQ